MSAKLLSSLTDENRNLKKQLGCMTKIFQLFGSAHFLSGRGMGNNHMRLLPGQNANHKMEPDSGTPKAKGKNREELVKEKERVSVESSRTSVSSSTCSSTFSSSDCKRTKKPEQSPSSNSNFAETASENLTDKQKSSLCTGRQSLDLRDVVKDSIHREGHELSVKTKSKEEGLGRKVKRIDSPRPMQLCESVKSKVAGLDGSSRVLAKLRDDSLSTAPKDRPRYSYDRRNSRDTVKSNTKPKELPRLSLDSRVGSMRSSASESRANYLLGDLQLGNGTSNKILNTKQEPGSDKRPTSLVAKLMGLEAFPDSIPTTQISEIKSCPNGDFDSMTRSLDNADEINHSQVFGNPRISQRDKDSPRLRTANSVIQPTSSSRFPLEPAPWKQSEGSRGSQKPDPFPSVYGEIEKRLTELEFKSSGKDLRALKQILEAMQKTRKRLENRKKEHASNFEAPTSNCNSLDRNSKITTHLSQESNHPITPTTRRTPKRSESPSVLAKQAKHIEKPRHSDSSDSPIDGTSYLRRLRTGNSEESIEDSKDKSTAEDLTPRNNYLRDPSRWSPNSVNKNTSVQTPRSMPILRASEYMARENPTRSTRSSGNLSPRLQQKKHVMERQSCISSSSNLNKDGRQSGKQLTESRSTCRKLKPKSHTLRQGDDQLSETSSELRNLNYQSDAISVQSRSNISSSSKIESEVTSTSCSTDINSIYQQKDLKNKSQAASFSEDISTGELTTATLEQPSPVSVLDASFYTEDSPSPVKKISNAFKDDETLNSFEAEWNLVDLDYLLNKRRPKFDQKERENAMHLVHKLSQPKCCYDEPIVDNTASFHEKTNQDHEYIAEILLASRLLKDQGFSSTTSELHPSSHLINPNLFFVLEQTKKSTELQDHGHSNEIISQTKHSEKIRRKLIFDTVNEILVRKSASEGSFGLQISPNKIGKRIQSEKKLLRELCSEMDHLQHKKSGRLDDEEDDLISMLSEDMIHQSEKWADHHGEVPGVVLDIERLIFKDLIDDVICGESARLKGWPSRHCRQLFSK